MKKTVQYANLKTIVVILSLTVVGGIFYNVKASNDTQILSSVVATTKTEKNKVLQQLQHLKATYDAAIGQKSALSNELMMQREKVIFLIADLKKSNNTIPTLNILKSRYFALESKMKILIDENNTLQVQNETLASQRDSMKLAIRIALNANGSLLVQNGKLSKSIVNEQAAAVVNMKNVQNVNEHTSESNEALALLNIQLSKSVAKAQKLLIINLNVVPETQKSSGKKVATEKASRADFLTISFTILENAMAPSGTKMFHVQILDPENNVLGDKKIENYGNKRLTYTCVSTIEYENKSITIQEQLVVKDLTIGTYNVNVFNNGELSSKTSFILK